MGRKNKGAWLSRTRRLAWWSKTSTAARKTVWRLMVLVISGVFFLFILKHNAIELRKHKIVEHHDMKLHMESKHHDPNHKRTEREVQADMDARIKRLQRECAAQKKMKMNLSREINGGNFFVAHRQRLMWCSVPKTANSVWLHHFVRLGEAGYSEEDIRRSERSLTDQARFHFPPHSKLQLKDSIAAGYTSFLVTRDPVERLLSAYRSHIENFTAPVEFKKLAHKIVEHFRAPCSSRRLDRTASFPEFVDYVIATANKPNNLWAPASKICNPCMVNYTMIGNYETFAEDHDLVLVRASLTELLRPYYREPNMTRPVSSSARVLPTYLRQLNQDQLEGLLKAYESDLMLFGYDTKRYYDMLGPQPNIISRIIQTIRKGVCEVFW